MVETSVMDTRMVEALATDILTAVVLVTVIHMVVTLDTDTLTEVA